MKIIVSTPQSDTRRNDPTDSEVFGDKSLLDSDRQTDMIHCVVCVSQPDGLLPWASGRAVKGLLRNNDPDGAGTCNQLSTLVLRLK